MVTVEAIIWDEAGEVISQQIKGLELGDGRFEQIEQAVEGWPMASRSKNRRPNARSETLPIIDYQRRQRAGKVIGSGRMEKGCDLVIGHRQKKKGMSWSLAGSRSLALLKLAELNGRWQSLWFSQPTLA